MAINIFTSGINDCRKVHYTYSFVIQRITWRKLFWNCLSFLENPISSTAKRVIGINFATVLLDWSVLSDKKKEHNPDKKKEHNPKRGWVRISFQERKKDCTKCQKIARTAPKNFLNKVPGGLPVISQAKQGLLRQIAPESSPDTFQPLIFESHQIREGANRVKTNREKDHRLTRSVFFCTVYVRL